MLIIPAIDLKEGRCVRLLKGDFSRETVYSKNPLEMAGYWQKHGAQYLHIVDLDGARNGKPQNLSIIKEIASSLDIPVQLGGGIRSLEIIDLYLKAGVDRVILGTLALEAPEVVKEALKNYGPERIVIGVDGRRGKVAVKGWLEDSDIDVAHLIKEMKEIGVKTFVYTDISKDGTLEGPDIAGLVLLNKIDQVDIIASGGVSSLEDLKELKEIGIKYSIVGKALYTGDLSPDLKKLQEEL